MTRERATNHPLDWEQRSCCLPRQNCMERSAFVRPRNRSLEFVNIYGLQVCVRVYTFLLFLLLTSASVVVAAVVVVVVVVVVQLTHSSHMDGTDSCGWGC